MRALLGLLQLYVRGRKTGQNRQRRPCRRTHTRVMSAHLGSTLTHFQTHTQTHTEQQHRTTPRVVVCVHLYLCTQRRDRGDRLHIIYFTTCARTSARFHSWFRAPYSRVINASQNSIHKI